MFRKLFCLPLVCLLLCCSLSSAGAETVSYEDGDLLIEEIMEEQLPSDAPSIYESDGSILLTISCTSRPRPPEMQRVSITYSRCAGNSSRMVSAARPQF